MPQTTIPNGPTHGDVRAALNTNVTDAETRLASLEGPRAAQIFIPSQGWKTLLQGYADPRYFGAAVDGTTDDTVAYQTASDELAAMALSGMFLQQVSTGTWQGGAAAPGAGTILVPPGVSILSRLALGHRVGLHGVGYGSILRQKAATTGSLVYNRWDGTVHAKACRLSNLLIDGNKANQSAANHGVYFFGSTTNVYNDPLDEDYDSYCRIHDVYVIRCKGTGVYLDGAGAHTIDTVKTRNCDINGIRAGQDNHIISCDVAWSGLAGIRIDGDSTRVTNSKSWFSGQITAASGAGFLFTADSGVVTGCAAQDNRAQGFLWDGAHGWCGSALEADSNDSANGARPGFDFWSSTGCNVQGIARNRYSGSNAVGVQETAVAVAGGSTNNDINITAGLQANGWGTSTLGTADATHRTNNRIFVNGVRLT